MGPDAGMIDPVQQALMGAFAGLQSVGAEAPTPASATQTLPTTPPPAQSPLSQPEMAQPTRESSIPAVADIPGTPAKEITPPTTSTIAPPAEEDDAQVESELLKNFDINIEDIVPPEILQQLYKNAKGGMSLPDALGIVSIAATHPEIAGQLLLQHDREKYAATNSLVNIGTQLGSIKKESARQVSMYMRARKDARLAQSKQDAAARDREYLERSKAATGFYNELAKSNVDPDAAGVPPISEEILRDPNQYAQWVQAASSAANKADAKQKFLQEIAGMTQYGPAMLAAKTGVDPTAGVIAYAKKLGFSDQELTQLQPIIKNFASAAKQQSGLVSAETQRAIQQSKYMESLIGKTNAEIAKIGQEIGSNPSIKRDKALQMTNTLQMLNMTATSDLQSAQLKLAAELQKPTMEKALADQHFWQAPPKADAVQNPDFVATLQARIDRDTQGIAESSQYLAQLAPIASGNAGALDVMAALQQAGPSIAEASRAAILGGRALPAGFPPQIKAEAVAAASNPATWLAYLKQPPIGPDGQPNPIRTAYWAAVVRKLGDEMGGAQDPADIIKLLDFQSAGQPSYADIYAGRDITLPAQAIQTQMQSLTPAAPTIAPSPAPQQPQQGGPK